MLGNLHLAPALNETGIDPSVRSPIGVVLADDHALMRRSLRRLLDGEADVEVIAEAGELGLAVRLVYEHEPTVLVLDLRMSDGYSIDAVSKLRERAPDTRVVVVTMEDDLVLARHALVCGALGFVLKEHADSELPQAVRAAARGEEFISPHLTTRPERVAR